MSSESSIELETGINPKKDQKNQEKKPEKPKKKPEKPEQEKLDLKHTHK